MLQFFSRHCEELIFLKLLLPNVKITVPDQTKGEREVITGQSSATRTVNVWDLGIW
jgi:hypothetical protein